MTAKDGELSFKWSKKEDDILFSWGKGVDKSDGSFLYLVLTNKIPVLDVSFQEELIKRGYDITTIKFSIQKKKSEAK